MRARTLSALLILATLSCVDRSKIGPGSGAIDITIAGLAAAPANVLVTGPGGYSRTVIANTLIDQLDPGMYTVTPGSVTVGVATYTATGGGSVNVTASNNAIPVPITYTLSTGVLTVTITGLPAGQAANVVVTGPSSFNQVLTATTTLGNLVPGSYTITANVVNSGGVSYAGAPASQNINVPLGITPTPAAVTYAQATGSLAVTVTGTPGGL